MRKLEGYETHLPVLKWLLDNFTIQTALEIGAGKASTGFLYGRGVKLMSAEHDMQWIRNLKGIYPHVHWIFLEFPLTKESWSRLFRHRRFDLVFVDGQLESRVPAVQGAFHICDFIVAHDTEDARYGWDRINVPFGWCGPYQWCGLTPCTSVWCRDLNARTILDGINELKCENPF